MSATLTPVRPHVYADPDGCEWRCVEGAMQSRDVNLSEEGGMDLGFTPNPLSDGDAMWRAWLASAFPQSLPAFDAAVADPMTAEWAEEDDCRIQEQRERTHVVHPHDLI